MENLLLSQYLAGDKTKKSAAIEMMEQLGILDLKNRKAHQISQGQAQRVSIARALLNNPVLLLADEPTASLDDENFPREDRAGISGGHCEALRVASGSGGFERSECDLE